VTGSTLFRAGQLPGVLLVISPEIRFIDRNTLCYRVEVQQDILDAGLFRSLKKFFIGLVELLDVGRRGAQLCGVICSIESRKLDFTFFKKSAQSEISRNTGTQTAASHTCQHLSPGQVRPHIGFKHFGTQTLGAEQLTITLHVKRAIGATQGGNLGAVLQFPCKMLVACGKLELFSSYGNNAVTNHTL